MSLTNTKQDNHKILQNLALMQLSLPYLETDSNAEPQPAYSKPAVKPMDVSSFFAKFNSMLTQTPWTREICIVGEVSSPKLSSGKHLFFSLKDQQENRQNPQQLILHCRIFYFNSKRYGAIPKDGERIIAYGDIVTSGYGSDIFLKVSKYEPDGQGQISAQLEALKEKLRREHLFDDARKRPLPAFPRVIGLITSDSGMAFGDIKKRFRERAPHVRLWLVPALVQGAYAPNSMISALHYLESLEEVDAIILGRGGGSREDLMAFNDERLVRAVAACTKPIVTAIGHDGDHSLCDLAADKIASTPTNAAEVILPSRDKLLEEISSYYGRILRLTNIYLQEQHKTVDNLRQRCQVSRPQNRIEQSILHLDAWRTRLTQIGLNMLKQHRHQLEVIRIKKGWSQTSDLIGKYRLELANWRMRAENAVLDKISGCQNSLEHCRTQLCSLDPHQALRRGYAIVSDSHGHPIASINELAPGQSLGICLQDGQASVRVEAVQPTQSPPA